MTDAVNEATAWQRMVKITGLNTQSVSRGSRRNSPERTDYGWNGHGSNLTEPCTLRNRT